VTPTNPNEAPFACGGALFVGPLGFINSTRLG
jgi:hypothetical protein